MKIISKYKDYYDYLTGIYGVDNKLVLDRRSGSTKPTLLHCKGYCSMIELHICDMIYEGIMVNNNIYYGEDMLPFRYERYDSKQDLKKGIIHIATTRSGISKVHLQSYPDPDLLNTELDCPILLYNSPNDIQKYPALSSFDFVKVVPPEELYIMLSTWIAYNNDRKMEQISPQSNANKIASHGFDNKSFKNTKHRIK